MVFRMFVQYFMNVAGLPNLWGCPVLKRCGGTAGYLINVARLPDVF
jgi:hypothetical protein